MDGIIKFDGTARGIMEATKLIKDLEADDSVDRIVISFDSTGGDLGSLAPFVMAFDACKKPISTYCISPSADIDASNAPPWTNFKR